jgi:alkanesulfonate monooxygenase SsuD/methylene tetrahydromethanopterin reductase-like flavin-dependent oxidoreductase (luciferase family)
VSDPLHLAVALDGAGWHPAAWREPEARPTELLSGRYWADLVTEAERGLLDLVTFEDGFALQTAAGGVRGRLDPVLVAARVAPLTRHIGLVPTVITTHTEPFHASKAIASLDHASTGRAGVRVRASADPAEAALFGRRPVLPVADLMAEAADHVEVMRRLWDSWEDDAEIRDVATGRFVDRDKLHYIDFTGRWFSVKGPSITPRPPQGRPPVFALGHGAPAYELIARSADVGFVTDLAAVAALPSVPLFGDLVVVLGDTPAAAAARRERLDGRARFETDAEVFTGTPGELADRLLHGRAAGLAGFRLRPATLPYDLLQITRGVVPELQRRNAFRIGYEAGTLRGLLGLPRPANRYVGV